MICTNADAKTTLFVIKGFLDKLETFANIIRKLKRLENYQGESV